MKQKISSKLAFSPVFLLGFVLTSDFIFTEMDFQIHSIQKQTSKFRAEETSVYLIQSLYSAGEKTEAAKK